MMDQLFGHEKQRAALAALALQERLPSSLLFAGVQGVGKQLVARELAAQLLCSGQPCGPQGGCGTCKNCALARSGNHPDLLLLSFGEDGAKMDDLRTALDRLSLKAFMGGRKVAILDNADHITAVGANTLLKSLEEPRSETFFILIASNPARLPQTVLSRCQRWFFDRLSPEALRDILAARGESAASSAAAVLTDGTLHGIDTVCTHSDMLSEVGSIIDAAFQGDERIISRAAQEWGADKEGLRDRLGLVRTSVRQKLLQSGRDAQAAAIWSMALQNVLDAEYLVLERHTNPTLVILEVLRSCNRANAGRYQELPCGSPSLAERLLER